jgi:hypothetical protein
MVRKMLQRIDYYYRHKIPLDSRGVGRFKLGDIVTWQARQNSKRHTGRVVEIVNYGMYPSCCPNEQEIRKVRKIEKKDIVWKNLIGNGYYREHESYVVEDTKGKRWWPRVGTLRLVE